MVQKIFSPGPQNLGGKLRRKYDVDSKLHKYPYIYTTYLHVTLLHPIANFLSFSTFCVYLYFFFFFFFFFFAWIKFLLVCRIHSHWFGFGFDFFFFFFFVNKILHSTCWFILFVFIYFFNILLGFACFINK